MFKYNTDTGFVGTGSENTYCKEKQELGLRPSRPSHQPGSPDPRAGTAALGRGPSGALHRWGETFQMVVVQLMVFGEQFPETEP